MREFWLDKVFGFRVLSLVSDWRDRAEVGIREFRLLLESQSLFSLSETVGEKDTEDFCRDFGFSALVEGLSLSAV